MRPNPRWGSIGGLWRRALEPTLIGVLSLIMLLPHTTTAIEESERRELMLEAKDMFYHGYQAYMENAWPADELMPLSCRGRYRGREPSRGDIDEALGNFSLTLIDSLDMLVILGDLDEFESGVLKVIEGVSFDNDVVVSVFETNIRIVGGLISAHVLAEYVRDTVEGKMVWYSGELLNMALNIANRLLPAFNSSTGLPYPRVNLRSGLDGVNIIQLTCTSCAGTMLLEFAALSRLSGEKIYEEKASKAMDVLWAARHRQSNLMGNVLNVNTGDWVRRDSGVGAGIDSYYEYVAKAYVLLGEEKYLERWNTHYTAVMKYLGVGPLMLDVHMHRPTTNSKHFSDALGAFFPGLQVLMGDLKPAIEQHEVLYQILKKHSFLPEAVTSDFQVHWGQHLLRPEFVESTYFLYKATQDPHYLEVGKKVLRSLQEHARVTCGYAAVKDVRTMQKEDRMDSFVLTETFKYLYLLFAKPEETFLDVDRFVFTTEAHLFPLTLARLSNTTAVPLRSNQFEDDLPIDEACPSTRYLFPEHDNAATAAESVRKPLGNIVEDTCPKQKAMKRRLYANDFQASNPDHLQLIQEMGINIVTMPDGRVQLLHSFAAAENQESAEEGLYFMQEMIEISKQANAGGPESPPKQVRFKAPASSEKEPEEVIIQAGSAQFGLELIGNTKLTGRLVLAGSEGKACPGALENGEPMTGKIVLVERGDCVFVEKGRALQSLGAIGGIVMDSNEGSAAATSPLFAMSGDGTNDVKIPLVFLFDKEAKILLEAYKENPDLEVTLEEKPELSGAGHESGKCHVAGRNIIVRNAHFLKTYQSLMRMSKIDNGKPPRLIPSDDQGSKDDSNDDLDDDEEDHDDEDDLDDHQPGSYVVNKERLVTNLMQEIQRVIKANQRLAKEAEDEDDLDGGGDEADDNDEDYSDDGGEKSCASLGDSSTGKSKLLRRASSFEDIEIPMRLKLASGNAATVGFQKRKLLSIEADDDDETEIETVDVEGDEDLRAQACYSDRKDCQPAAMAKEGRILKEADLSAEQIQAILVTLKAEVDDLQNSDLDDESLAEQSLELVENATLSLSNLNSYLGEQRYESFFQTLLRIALPHLQAQDMVDRARKAESLPRLLAIQTFLYPRSVNLNGLVTDAWTVYLDLNEVKDTVTNGDKLSTEVSEENFALFVQLSNRFTFLIHYCKELVKVIQSKKDGLELALAEDDLAELSSLLEEAFVDSEEMRNNNGNGYVDYEEEDFDDDDEDFDDDDEEDTNPKALEAESIDDESFFHSYSEDLGFTSHFMGRKLLSIDSKKVSSNDKAKQKKKSDEEEYCQAGDPSCKGDAKMWQKDGNNEGAEGDAEGQPESESFCDAADGDCKEKESMWTKEKKSVKLGELQDDVIDKVSDDGSNSKIKDEDPTVVNMDKAYKEANRDAKQKADKTSSDKKKVKKKAPASIEDISIEDIKKANREELEGMMKAANEEYERMGAPTIKEEKKKKKAGISLTFIQKCVKLVETLQDFVVKDKKLAATNLGSMSEREKIKFLRIKLKRSGIAQKIMVGFRTIQEEMEAAVTTERENCRDELRLGLPYLKHIQEEAESGIINQLLQEMSGSTDPEIQQGLNEAMNEVLGLGIPKVNERGYPWE